MSCLSKAAALEFCFACLRANAVSAGESFNTFVHHCASDTPEGLIQLQDLLDVCTAEDPSLPDAVHLHMVRAYARITQNACVYTTACWCRLAGALQHELIQLCWVLLSLPALQHVFHGEC